MRSRLSRRVWASTVFTVSGVRDTSIAVITILVSVLIQPPLQTLNELDRAWIGKVKEPSAISLQL
jgi:hypothetical protein